MNVTREDLPGRQVALTIELDMETVNGALDRAYRQMVNQVNVPGFRRGKAPRYVLESFVGKEALTERAVRNILPDTVREAISDQNIDAMDIGDVDIVSMDPIQVKVIIVQPPSVELGDYGTIRVEKETVEMGESDVENVLLEMRREGAPWNEPAEARPIREGDMVYLNLEGFTTEGELAEAKRENFPTIVGMERGGIPMSVSNALVDMQVGEEKDITDTLPDDYPVEEMRGRDITYHVATLSMKEQNLPEMSDDWVKEVSKGEYETIDTLREAVEKSLRQRADESAENNQANSAVRQLVESATVDVPDSMVKEELDAMLKDVEERMKRQRLSLRQYFSYTGTSEADWRAQNEDRARERVIRTLVLQEFARRESIDVDEDEIEREVSTMLERFEGEERDEAMRVLETRETRRDLQDRLYQQKLVERLIGIAEGSIEAAPTQEADTSEGEESAEEAPIADEDATGHDDEAAVTTDATDIEEAAGAAEVLGAGDVRSPYETGEAEGGGTPEGAPRLGN